jgi:hypothetical protein
LSIVGGSGGVLRCCEMTLTGLFGWHVSGSADDQARLGQARVVERNRQAEIAKLGARVGG